MIYQYLPPLDDDQRHALRQSIEANGILQPIEVDEDGNILDGHHRKEIARELGIECPRRVVAGLDETGKRKYAVTVNLMRRQMSPTVRGALVAQLRTEGMSVRRISAETGIPRSTVERDLSRVPHGTPDEITGADGKTYAAIRPTDSPAGRADAGGADQPGPQTPRDGGIGGVGAKRDAGTDAAPRPEPEPERPKPPAWAPEERRQHEAEVRRVQDIESARRTAQTIVTEVRSLVVTVVTGSRYGEKGLVTADMIRELREAINLLEGEL